MKKGQSQQQNSSKFYFVRHVLAKRQRSELIMCWMVGNATLRCLEQFYGTYIPHKGMGEIMIVFPSARGSSISGVYKRLSEKMGVGVDA